MRQCAARQVPVRPKTATVIWLPSVDGKVGGCITTTTSTPFIPLRAARAVAKLCGLCAQSTHLSVTCVKCGLQRRANPRRFLKCLRLAPLLGSNSNQQSRRRYEDEPGRRIREPSSSPKTRRDGLRSTWRGCRSCYVSGKPMLADRCRLNEQRVDIASTLILELRSSAE